jgi:ATP-dependent DNA helicase RecG
MAPTEILAHQHYNVFRKYLDRAKITTAILVGNQPAKERRKILEGLKNGNIQVVVGTHALIQEDVEFSDLGLAIVDEQHRFGVVQRGTLAQKGMNPDMLVMTATPIPRTLAITYHGDLDLSVIDEMPKNRIPVTTRVVAEDKVPKVYQFIRDQVEKGNQCMIVYPLIEESERLDLKAVVDGYDTLSKKIFPKFKLALIHGRMKKDEKDTVMDAFGRNEIQILVSTTVIEVGIDVPNATVMLIENAERFGLTQLHQLRGRIGRGTEKGYCILIQRGMTATARRRLDIISSTTNGFEISDEDLKLRGPGEFYGTRQHGFMKWKIADLVYDGDIITEARKAAFDLVDYDPKLKKQEHAGIRSRFLHDYQHMLEYVNIS